MLSFDEKGQIQALDRTQPGLPLQKGRLGTMTHDYKRNGTTTLFAALNILDGTVIGRNMQKHRHQGFICFLNTINTINTSVPGDKAVHVIRTDLARRNIQAVIPGRSNRRVKIEHDRALYKERKHIERFFGRPHSTAQSQPDMTNSPKVSSAWFT